MTWKGLLVQNIESAKRKINRLQESLNQILFFLENGNVTDPQYNAVLRATLEECRRNNVPKETIDRSIKRAVRFS